MTALLISPDYASHYLPISAIGAELRDRGLDVVVATGAGLAARAEADGFEHRLLTLGPGSNPGLMRIAEQSSEEATQLAAFFAATRRGPIATLRHQAEERLTDLLWQPTAVTDRLAEILDEVQPDIVLSDQIAFGASLALRALERPYASLLVGHPTALPGPGELFGLPPYFPPALAIDPDALAALRSLCERVDGRFAAEFGAVLRRLNPRAAAPASPFAAGSPWLTLLNYPRGLARHRRRPARSAYLGACVRKEPVDRRLESEIVALPHPRVYVSLGSFMSVREDVLLRIATAFRDEPVSLVVASGMTDPTLVAEVNDRALVHPYLPQAGLLRHFDLVVCHGGNNTVTESFHTGVPLLVAPFSSDQFAGAADVRRAGLGDAFDPNGAPPAEIADRARRLLAGAAPVQAAVLGQALRSRPGPAAAANLLIAARDEPAGRLRRRTLQPAAR